VRTTAPSNADVLSAGSLLLAVLAVLFGLWYSDIAAALQVEVPTHLEDAGRQRRQVADAIKTRAAPLAAAAATLLAIFLPEAIRLTSHWVQRAYDNGLWNAVRSYDPVELSIVAVVLFLAVLTAYTLSLIPRLIRLKRKLHISSQTGVSH